MIEKLHYRPEIDGLRAVAVASIVLFHAGFGCPGGYVGVDVFFVISGYLITALIWQDLENGNFGFWRFLEKRARRIIPALVGVTGATLVAGWFLLLPNELSKLGEATASQAVFAANFHYWLETGYFEGVSEEKPLLHTWSLAVEEQFYAVVPWLLCGVFAASRWLRRSVVLLLLTLLAGLSFLLSLWGVRYAPSATFYLLPARVWELLCGSVVAFVPSASLLQRRRNQCGLLSAGGLLLILLPVFCYDVDTPFPGLAAVPPCFGAGLLLWSERHMGGSLTRVGKFLSHPICVFIGLISYSLYLWHWPLFAYAKLLAIEPLTPLCRASLLGCGVLLALVSWKFVETPFRQKKLGGTRQSMFVWAGSSLATVCGLGWMFVAAQGVPQRFSQRELELADAQTDMSYVHQMTVEDVRSGRLVSIGTRDVQLQPTVLVWGDSHAMAAMPAIDSLLSEKGLAGRAALHSSTLPLCGWYVPTRYGLHEESLAFGAEVIQRIEAEKIQEVILIAYWRGYGLDEKQRAAEFARALIGTIEQLVAVGARPWILLDVPVHSFPVPKAVSRGLYTPRYIASLCSTPTTLGPDGPNSPELIARIEAAGGRVLDPKPMFLNASGEYYCVLLDDVPLYRDAHHLTTQGARQVLLPFLRNAMSELGK